MDFNQEFNYFSKLKESGDITNKNVLAKMLSKLIIRLATAAKKIGKYNEVMGYVTNKQGAYDYLVPVSSIEPNSYEMENENNKEFKVAA